MSKILALILTALAITFSTGARADQEGGPPIFAGNFTAAAEWVEVTWKDWKFSLPANWTQSENSGWGLFEPRQSRAVFFHVLVKNKPFKEIPFEKGDLIDELGRTWVGNIPATGFLVTTKGLWDRPVIFKAVCLDAPQPDGSYVMFSGGVEGLAWEDHQATIERVFASIKNTSAP